MQRTEKERVVAELAEQLRSTESLIVADYRGLTNAELVGLRSKVRSSGGRFQVVKNTLTRRAATSCRTWDQDWPGNQRRRAAARVCCA